jgi:isopentenyl-diphosphate delta-isomerase
VSSDGPTRKRRHVDACLHGDVAYRTRTTGFETLDLPYRALPETDLATIDTSTAFLRRRLSAPLLIGAMTGGAERAAVLNRNLAIAAQRVGVGMMLGSQRVMLEDPALAPTFAVREHAPDVPLIGNLGVAQLNRGYGADAIRRAIDAVDADALALHANPLQEAVQEGGDGDFRGLLERLATLPAEVGRPLLLKEVGHGLDAGAVRRLAGAGYAAFDVAGAGGTSWARVEAWVRWGEVRSEDLVEWGVPTLDALRAARRAAPGATLIASGGIRSGLDVAKAIASGARLCAVALPLLAPATESPDAVEAVLRRFVDELRIAMHGAGAPDLAALARIRPVPRRTPRAGA